MQIQERKKIGIDLDEVIVEFVKPFIEFFNKKYNKKINPNDFKSYNFWENGIGNNKEEAVSYVKEFFNSKEFESISFVKDAKESINQLRADNDVFIITSRPKYVKNQTEKFLADNFNFPLKVYYSGDFHLDNGFSKGDFAKILKLDYFIDDSVEYATACSGFCKKILLFDKPWNQNVILADNIIRVNNWEKILDMIYLEEMNNAD